MICELVNGVDGGMEVIVPETYLSGQGGSNTNPWQSRENASEIVVQAFSDAHHAHSPWLAHPLQSE